MFAKLLKHEWKATVGILGWLSLAALGLGALGAVVLRVSLSIADDTVRQNLAIADFLQVGLWTMLIFLALALVLYAAGTQFLLLLRFYKNKFTDEGYLTFTLPVNSHQIFLSAYLNMLLWMVISAVVVAAAVFIAALFGTAKSGLVNTEIFPAIVEGIREWQIFEDPDQLGLGFHSFLVMQLLQPVFSAVFGTLITMSCVTVGSVAAKKHKLLAAFGVYYGVNMVLSTVTMILTVFFADQAVSATWFYNFWDIFIPETLPRLLLAVGGYFLSVYLMRNKLNLP